MTTTPVSLLVRLRQSDDHDAWRRFAALYSPLLLHWSRSLGLQDADAADLVQEVFVVLVSALPSFQHRQGQRFRGWLRTLTVNKHRERLRRREARPEAGSAWLEDVAAEPVNAVEEAEYR